MNQRVFPAAYEVLQLPSDDAGLLEQMRLQVEPVTAADVDDLCDFFGVARPISFEPGQVMSWEKYRRLEAQQKQK